MVKFVFILTAVFATTYSFDDVEFQKKHCYESVSERTTDYYFSIATERYTTHPGFVCDNFTLTKEDLESMSSAIFTEKDVLFFKNCEIPSFNKKILSKFPSVGWLFFDNCKISLDDFGNNSTSAIWNNIRWLGFHDCEIFNNMKSLESVFTDLNGLSLHNSTMEYPLPDNYSKYAMHMEKMVGKHFPKRILPTEITTITDPVLYTEM